MVKNWGWSYLDCISINLNTDLGTSLQSNKILKAIVSVTGKMILVQPQIDSQYQLHIREISGRLILTKLNQTGQITVNEINKTGIYFLSITNFSGNSVYKIIIN